MKHHLHILLSAFAVGSGCGDNSEQYVAAGGDTTVIDRTSRGFSNPAANLSQSELERHLQGDVFFESKFVTAPAPSHGGLGPLYNNTACRLCHGGDGRGLPQIGDGPSSQALIRVSLPTGTPTVPGGAVPVPGFGTQLQNHATFGASAEVRVTLAWIESYGQFADGTTYSLRQPKLTIEPKAGTVVPVETQMSFRIAPSIFGLGLLAAIPEQQLRLAADTDDSDGDGISGRVNEVWSPSLHATVVGRFGAKANTANLKDQSGAAFANDMGVTSPAFLDGDVTPDIDSKTVDDTAFYTATLAVPERLPLDNNALRGKRLFNDFGCASCHTATQRTGASEISALAQQTFSPYTDLLLHDMGPGLADGRPDFLATGQEWRTAPLWGIGLVQTVLAGAGFLHDGRARNLSEAILWHGGEAARARQAFVDAALRDRTALLGFLSAL
jgi:CxxC motif-containing protein (DUF1111 family)